MAEAVAAVHDACQAAKIDCRVHKDCVLAMPGVAGMRMTWHPDGSGFSAVVTDHAGGRHVFRRGKKRRKGGKTGGWERTESTEGKQS